MKPLYLYDAQVVQGTHFQLRTNHVLHPMDVVIGPGSVVYEVKCVQMPTCPALLPTVVLKVLD
jgi:hypothetical protein